MSFFHFLSFMIMPFFSFIINEVFSILGRILLDPSTFDRNDFDLHNIPLEWSTLILESISSIGLLFFLFLVDLELDLSSTGHSGHMTFVLPLLESLSPSALASVLCSSFVTLLTRIIRSTTTSSLYLWVSLCPSSLFSRSWLHFSRAQTSYN